MTQQFFPLELNGRFYLKDPKSKYPSTLIFIVRINDRKYKLAINAKVYPVQWNQSLQKAYISPILTNADNKNNSIVNQKIEEVKELFMSFKLYLCNIKAYNEELIAQSFNNIMKRQKKPNSTNKIDNIIKVIHDAVYNDGNTRQGTKDNYINKGLPALKFYIEHLKNDENINVDNFGYFTSEFFNAFGRYIYENYTQDSGEFYAVSTINSIIKYAKSAVILCARSKQFLTEATIATIKVRLFKDKSASNHIALRNDEVMLLYNYRAPNKQDEIIRDMFLLECTLGHRITDILRIDEHIQKTGDSYYAKMTPKKTPDKTIEVDILFEIAKKILIDKYKCKLPKFTKELINKNIKRIAKEAGIKGKEVLSYHYQRESEPTQIEKDRYNCISTHTGRRTFVTLLAARGWTYEEIKKYTGQTVKVVELYDKSTPMYNSIYKESLEKRPYEIVRLLSETKDQDTIIPTTLDDLLQILFREQDLLDLKDLKQNKVDLSTLEKTAQVKKYLEDIDRVRKYKQPLQEYYQTEPEMLKQRLVEILRTTTLIDPTYNLTRVLVTILQKLGVDCVYADNTYKYPNKAAWEAYLLVITNEKGVIIL